LDYKRRLPSMFLLTVQTAFGLPGSSETAISDTSYTASKPPLSYYTLQLLLLLTSVQLRPVIAPVVWGHLLRCFWNQVVEMYGLAQLGHLKQPRSPACPTNNDQLWLNSSLLSSSEASRPAKLQMWLRSSAKSATRVRWRPRLLRSTCENTTSWTISSSWRMNDQPSRVYAAGRVEPMTWQLSNISELFHLTRGLAT